MNKKNVLWMLAFILFCGLTAGVLMACGDDEDNVPQGNEADDLSYLQNRIANDGSLVYGVRLGTDANEVINRPVATTDEALEEFYKLMPGGSAHQGLSKGNDGIIICHLTDAKGKSQGTITYRLYQSETVYYCAEVSFSTEVKSATGISCLRFILYDRWPEEGNGSLKDIMKGFKK